MALSQGARARPKEKAGQERRQAWEKKAPMEIERAAKEQGMARVQEVEAQETARVPKVEAPEPARAQEVEARMETPEPARA